MKTNFIYRQFNEYQTSTYVAKATRRDHLKQIKKRKKYFNQRSNLSYKMRSYIISFIPRSSSGHRLHKFDINILCFHILLLSYRNRYDEIILNKLQSR